MRGFIDGNGLDSTEAVRQYLELNRKLYIADLFVINTAPCYAGQYLDKPFLLTSWPAPLQWSFIGKFLPATIERGQVESKIGLEADTLDVTWSPKDSDILADDGSGNTLLTALQGFSAGVFDNGLLQVWRVVMPTPGDCDSLGACCWFAGRMGDISADQLNVDIQVISRLEVLNVQVPTNTIEPSNIYAQYATGIIPAGAATSYTTVTGSTASKLYGDASPTMPPDTYDTGFLFFTSGRLAGTYARIRQQTVESGHHAFYLSGPLPFAPAAGDTFEPRAPVPQDMAAAAAAGAGVAGFRYVPSAVNSPVVMA